MIFNNRPNLTRALYAGAGCAVLLAGCFASASAEAEPLDNVNSAIAKICASKQKALVVDVFSPAGDPVAGHGDIVGAVLSQTGKEYFPYNIPVAASGFEIPGIFNSIAAEISEGKIEKPSHINFSTSLPISLNFLNSLDSSLSLTPENLRSKKDEILRSLYAMDEKDGDNYHRAIFDAFAQIDRMGIKIVTIAGNEGSPDVFNVLSLMPGTITVGAVDADLKTPARYTNENTLTDTRRFGEASAELLPRGKIMRPAITFGTSFAAPRVCAQ